MFSYEPDLFTLTDAHILQIVAEDFNLVLNKARNSNIKIFNENVKN